MTDEERALAELSGAGVLAALLWATQSAHRRAFSDFDSETGHTQTVLGISAHALLADRQDRIFRSGKHRISDEDAPEQAYIDVLYATLTVQDRQEMPAKSPAGVTRANFNGSDGWRYADYQWFLNAYPPGGIDQIVWSRKSPTKVGIAARAGRQSPDQFVIPTSFDQRVDFQAEYQTIAELLASDPELSVTRLVLAHSVDPRTGLSEVFIGQPRLNTRGGPCWLWRKSLHDEDGMEGGRLQGATPRPSGPDDVPDAPVRLRPRIAEDLPYRNIKDL